MLKLLFLSSITFCIYLSSFADDEKETEIKIATASNFVHTLKKLTENYKNIRITSGSTSQLYHQITFGADYDIFLSADREHVNLLIEKKLAFGKSFTYAIGRAVVWCKSGDINTANHISIANPKTAPYGEVAMNFLKKEGIYDKLSNKLIIAKDVATAYHYVEVGGAECGIIPKSFINDNSNIKQYTEIDEDIIQSGIILRNNPGVEEFVKFLISPDTCKKIKQSNYLC